MRVVEFAGMVGAGKSTLAEGVGTRLRREGKDVLSLDETVERAVRHTRALRRIPGTRWATRLATAIGTIGFVSAHLGLSWRVLKSQWGLPITIKHRRIILGLFFRQVGALSFVARRVRDDLIVILDEGPVHRAVNLFSWAPEVDRRAVGAYLEALPSSGPVAFVIVPRTVAAERTRARGYPKRLDAADDVAVQGFMDRMGTVIDVVEEHLVTGSRPTIVVRNETDPAATLVNLTTRLAPYLDQYPQQGLRSTPLRHIRLPRPDRVAARSGPGWDLSIVDELQQLYGFGADSSVRPTANSGRSDTAIILTEQGRKFVKRYKAGFTADRVRHEHGVLDHLARKAFASPRLVPARDGATTVSIGGRQYAVFDYLAGRFHYHHSVWPFTPRREFISLSAAALAELHAALADFADGEGGDDGIDASSGTRPHNAAWARATLAAADPTPGLSPRRPSGAAIAASGARVVDRLTELEDSLDAAAPTRGTIHGDFGPYNVLFSWEEPTAVVDFELARYDWLVSDIAKALYQFGVGRTGFRIDWMRAFVNSYAAAGILDPFEFELLPAVWEYLALRRVVVCWERGRVANSVGWLAEADAKLELASSIAQRADTLAALQQR